MKMGDKPIGIVVASWNPNEPRFIVTEATESLSDNRKFVNGKCVENQRLKIVYSVEDIVEVLNNYGEFEKEYTELKKENEQLRQELKNRSAFIIDKGLGDTFVRWKNE